MDADPRRALDALAIVWSNRDNGPAAIRSAVSAAYGDDVSACDVGHDVPSRHRTIVGEVVEQFGEQVLAPVIREHLELEAALLAAIATCGGDVDGILRAVGAAYDELADEEV